MSSIEIRKVKTRQERKAFVEFHYELYEGNEYDAPGLFRDELENFDEKKNPAYEFCEAECYLAYKDGRLAGRIAAIINHKANEQWQRKCVRFGWIDLIDDVEVMKALLQAVEDYGRQRGMKEVIGPMGFTDMDPEGMLTYGFDQLGTMATIYNYPYYPQLMEKLQWEKDIDYVEYKLFVPDEMPEKFSSVAQLVEKRYNLHVRKLTRREVLFKGLGLKVFHIINHSFSQLYQYSELSDKQIMHYLWRFVPYINMDLITVVEDWNTPDHRMVGVGITIPSLTRALQKCRRGRLLPFGWWHLLRVLKFYKTNIVDCLLIGVDPEYRRKGANAFMFYDLIPRYQKYGFIWGETHVEMESNEKVQGQWQYIERELHKRRRVYKKLIETDLHELKA